MAIASGEWDFFISYTQADRAWAEWIAWILEEDSHRVLIQAWDFVPGSNWTRSMQEGVTKARRTIAVLSEAYLASVFGAAEWQAAWNQDPTGARRKLLTARVADCDRPGLLSGVTGIDVFGIDETKAEARLRSAVAAAAQDRVKPEFRPGFPGPRRALQHPARFPGALPTVWKVPARNPNFIGRAEDLQRLAREVTTGSRVIVHSIHGMGGVGKSHLATEYAYVNAGQYDLVWWLDAEEAATIPDQFTRLANELGVEPATDRHALQAQVHRALQGVDGWLLIFDNADQVETLRPWLPAMPLPPAVPGHVIVTTRRSGFRALGEVFDVDVLDMDSAVSLLLQRMPSLDPAVATEIAETLDRLPLALEQAAAFLDRTQMPAEEYVEFLKTRTEVMLDRGRSATHSDTVATVWRLSFERLESEYPAAMQLMDICAYMAADAIPLNIFTEHCDSLPDLLSGTASDSLRFSEAIAALVDYSLAKRADSGLQIHRLVQAALRARHQRGMVLESSPEINQGPHATVARSAEPWPATLRLLRAATPGAIRGEPQNWPRWTQLLPHVLVVTSYVEETPTASAPQATVDTAWLLARAAAYLRVQARPSEAKPLMERALHLAEATYGPDHPDVGTMLSLLAEILRDLGDAASAKPIMERSLHLAESTYGPHHPDVATRLILLAIIMRELGDAAGAKPLTERALRIDEATHGPDHPTVAMRLGSLAGILRDLGDAVGARPLMERALHIDESTFGSDHPTTAAALNNLALIIRDLDDAAAARRIMERALAIKERTYGPDHPEVASSLSSLALILLDLDEAVTSRSLMERALYIRESTYGPDHPEVASSLSNLASILVKLDDEAEARSLMERARHIRESTYGPDHPTVAALRSDLPPTSDPERHDG